MKKRQEKVSHACIFVVFILEDNTQHKAKRHYTIKGLFSGLLQANN